MVIECFHSLNKGFWVCVGDLLLNIPRWSKTFDVQFITEMQWHFAHLHLLLYPRVLILKFDLFSFWPIDCLHEFAQ